MISAKQTEKIHILIVGTQSLSCTSLAFLLGRHEHLQILGSVSTPNHILEVTKSARLDLLLVDLDRREGIDPQLVSSLHAQLPQVPIITLSTRVDAALFSALLTTGAQAHLSKEMTEDELLAVIGAVARGEQQQFVATTLLKHLLPTAGEGAARQVIERLTKREREVVVHLLQGLDPDQIASAMQVNYQTVRNYAWNIYGKLGVRSRAELILKLAQRQSE